MKKHFQQFKEIFFESYFDSKNNDELTYLKSTKNLRQINNIYFLWNYNKEFKKILSNYKYNKIKKISFFISKLIDKEIKFILDKEKIDIIISVPINKIRKSERGFNQIDEILNHLNLNYIELKRTKNTKKMHAFLNTRERKKNIKNSFTLDDNIDLRNKNILIIDDVITTGSTVKELKNEILKNNKNIKITIFCFSLAYTMLDNRGEI